MLLSFKRYATVDVSKTEGLPTRAARAIIQAMATYEMRCNRFTWVNLVTPTPDDIRRLGEVYPYIHPLHLEDMLSPLERPKVDEDENYLFVVTHFPVWDPQNRLSRSSGIEFLVGRNVLITIHDGTLKPMVRLFAQYQQHEDEHTRLAGKGANDVFYMIVDQLVDYIFPILNKVDGNLRAIEDSIFTADARQIVRDIALVRRDIIVLRRMIRHLVPIVENLAHTEHPIIREDLEEYFDDAVDHLYAARDIIDEDAEVIAGLADTTNTLVTHRLNDVMRVLTVISVIMLPLTLVSGIYGMNIELPLMEHPAAFIVLMMLMLFIAFSMLLYFRYRKWI
jgi:magnesium transporter